MCMTLEEMNKTMAEIKEWERIKEQAEDNITGLKAMVIEFLKENEATCKTTNDKGKEIFRFVGNVHKATLSEQERETVDKKEVKKILSADDYLKVSKISSYPVLRIG